MFWSGPKKKEDEKEKQLKQLKYAFPSIRRPNNDDSLFEIRFLVENSHHALRIAIPSDFPISKPVLDVAGNVSHPWLDQYKRVIGSQKLNNWGKHSVLTEVVEETLAALSLATNTASSTPAPATVGAYTGSYTVPTPYPGPVATPIHQSLSNQNLASTQSQIYNSPPSHSSAIQQQPVGLTPPYGSSKLNNPPNPSRQDLPPSTKNPAITTQDDFDFEGEKSPIPLPEIPQSFPELEKLTDLQLERLLSDEVALENMIGNQNSIEQMTILRDEMRNTNSEKASKNVLLGEELHTLRSQAEQLQKQLKDTTSQYLKEYSEKTKKHILNSEEVFSELNLKNELIDQESEKTADKFLAGEIDVSSFIQGYLEQRTRYHTLNAKLLLTKQ